ncbi:PEP-CTERM sorting domain-containing protein [Lacipirellula sp.]|uniref:PEP-CTERM sorting domain-containing protein n=1 Tax=Lacipirellula sp. TaxID=2691419 RepID=UPI003D0FB996
MHSRKACLLLCLVFSAAIAQQAKGQALGKISILVGRNAFLGPSGYQIRVLGEKGGNVPDADLSIAAPDGTVFQSGNFSIASLSLDQIVARFVGQWTINDVLTNMPGSPIQHHSFSVAAADLTTFPSTPAITSPPAGAHVPAVFSFTSTGNGITIRGPGVSFAGSYPQPGTYQADLSYYSQVLPQVVEAVASFSVSNSLGNATPAESSPSTQFSINLVSTDYAAPVQWTVGVPEPATVTMAGMSLVAFAALRRRK